MLSPERTSPTSRERLEVLSSRPSATPYRAAPLPPPGRLARLGEHQLDKRVSAARTACVESRAAACAQELAIGPAGESLCGRDRAYSASELLDRRKVCEGRPGAGGRPLRSFLPARDPSFEQAVGLRFGGFVRRASQDVEVCASISLEDMIEVDASVAPPVTRRRQRFRVQSSSDFVRRDAELDAARSHPAPDVVCRRRAHHSAVREVAAISKALSLLTA